MVIAYYDPTPAGALLAMGTCLLVGGLLVWAAIAGGRVIAGRDRAADVPDAATPELAAQIDDRLPHRIRDQDSDMLRPCELARWTRPAPLTADEDATWHSIVAQIRREASS